MMKDIGVSVKIKFYILPLFVYIKNGVTSILISFKDELKAKPGRK